MRIVLGVALGALCACDAGHLVATGTVQDVDASTVGTDARAVTGADASSDASGGAPDGPTGSPVAMRQISPLSAATATSQQPRFHWVRASGDDAVQVEVCRDRACTDVVTTFLSTGSTGAPSVVLDRGTYYWRVRGSSGGVLGSTTTPVWQVNVPSRSAPIDGSWGSVLDLDGDARADVASSTVGVGTSANFAGTWGNVAVYPGGGSSGGVVEDPFMLSHPTADITPLWGASVSSAGDIDGDGFVEAIAGSTGYNGGTSTFAIYPGGASGVTTTPTVFMPPAGAPVTFGWYVAGAGDTDGDGYADVLVDAPPNSGGGGAYLYRGSASGLGASPTSLTTYCNQYATGGGVAGAGDVNGDGYADALVRCDDYVSIYYGGAGGLTTTPITFVGAIGASPIAGAGDLNGDGYADVIVGIVDRTLAVFYGSAQGLGPATYVALPSGGAWILAAAGAGDVNGDGYADVVVGRVIGNYDDGLAEIFFGGPGGLDTTPLDLPGTLREERGWSVAGAGDINRDGFDDIAVGSRRSGTYVFLGSASGVSSTPANHISQGGLSVAL